jgi:hypothetical protein
MGKEYKKGEGKVGEEILESMVGGEGWRFRVWSEGSWPEGSWPFHGLRC